MGAECSYDFGLLYLTGELPNPMSNTSNSGKEPRLIYGQFKRGEAPLFISFPLPYQGRGIQGIGLPYKDLKGVR